MRISTHIRYALRAVVDLALHDEGEPILRREIAERQNISADYLAQLFRKLREAGLIQGVMGPGGGYVLAKDPDDIRVGDVFRAVEGPIVVTKCVLPYDDTPCERENHCATQLFWKQLSKLMENYMDSITLKDLCEEERKCSSGEGCHELGFRWEVQKAVNDQRG